MSSKAYKPVLHDDADNSSSTETELVLKDITFSIHKGELLVVVGPVGSSKSSLLMAIMKELYPIYGENDDDSDRYYESASKSTKIAYCAQEPWIMSNTIRANILFGRVFNEEM